MQLRIHPAAIAELEEALRYSSATFGPAAAQALFERIERIGELLLLQPDLGTPHPASARTVPLGRFPFSLVYRVDDSVITILALMHQSRQPGYWLTRARE